MAGGVGTAVQYTILILLVNHLDINAVLASSIGFLLGALVNYNLSYFWVFKSNKSHKETSVKFLITASLGFLLNFCIMFSLFEVFKLHYLFSQVVATGSVLVWNFLVNHFWTFNNG